MQLTTAHLAAGTPRAPHRSGRDEEEAAPPPTPDLVWHHPSLVPRSHPSATPPGDKRGDARDIGKGGGAGGAGVFVLSATHAESHPPLPSAVARLEPQLVRRIAESLAPPMALGSSGSSCWAMVRTLAMLHPSPQLQRGKPITSAQVRTVAGQLGLRLERPCVGLHLLPLAVHLIAAPLPAHWQHTDDGRYTNTEKKGHVTDEHPLLPLFAARAKELLERGDQGRSRYSFQHGRYEQSSTHTLRSAGAQFALRSVDGWMQFADAFADGWDENDASGVGTTPLGTRAPKYEDLCGASKRLHIPLPTQTDMARHMAPLQLLAKQRTQPSLAQNVAERYVVSSALEVFGLSAQPDGADGGGASLSRTPRPVLGRGANRKGLGTLAMLGLAEAHVAAEEAELAHEMGEGRPDGLRHDDDGADHVSSLLDRLERATWPARSARLAARPCMAAEVLHAAFFLGMDHTTPPRLFWLADYARGAPLPLGWTQHEAAALGRREPVPYFYNEALGITTWEHPAYSQLRTLYQALHGERGGGLEALERSAEPGACGFRWQLRRVLG